MDDRTEVGSNSSTAVFSFELSDGEPVELQIKPADQEIAGVVGASGNGTEEDHKKLTALEVAAEKLRNELRGTPISDQQDLLDSRRHQVMMQLDEFFSRHASSVVKDASFKDFRASADDRTTVRDLIFSLNVIDASRAGYEQPHQTCQIVAGGRRTR